MLAHPESTALLIERHQLASLATNAAVKEGASKLIYMYYTAIPELGCEKLIEDKLKQPILLLQWDEREEVIDLPQEEPEPQPEELSIEARRSIIAYAMWAHKASARYVECDNIPESTLRPTLLPSERLGYAPCPMPTFRFQSHCMDSESEYSDIENEVFPRLMPEVLMNPPVPWRERRYAPLYLKKFVSPTITTTRTQTHHIWCSTKQSRISNHRYLY
jgi:hypothetical protein